MKSYDVIIIGGGPAGLTAAIYCARYKLKSLVISKNIGGTAATAYKICNFPSYNTIKGFELMQKITNQATELGIEIVYETVENIEKTKKGFSVFANKKSYECNKLIYAAGTERIRLGVAGEAKFLGRGVSYCATCDASFYKNKNVAVIGGSDAALSSALLLSEFASKVYIIYRKSKFEKAEPYWIHLIEKERKIDSIFNEEILEIKGKESVEEISLKSGKNLKIEGVFIETGSIPETQLIKSLGVKLDEKGYILADKSQRTNSKGIYAAGDVTNNPLKQIITAASDGAIAAYSAYKDMKKEEDKKC
ncbi:Sulfide dehydrogenase subunit alpha [uncultured archaeon]|nr:Sulfide dehydrogenase subunit alpha [uncultured archaeon]